MTYKLAVDFGTTNSVVAVWDGQTGAARPQYIPGLSGDVQGDVPPLIPSLLYVKDGRSGDVLLGQKVITGSYHQKSDNRLFRNFKRGILSQITGEGRLIDGVPWSDLDAGKRFLDGLLRSLPYPTEEIEQLVLTVPVAAFDGYLAWLSEGIDPSLADRIHLVDESTAAALGYSVTEPGALVLVFDFGGGSLDLSLVQLPENRRKTGVVLNYLRGKSTNQHTARVVAKVGLSLGGSDIDHWLLEEILQRGAITITELGLDYAALLAACETAKVTLSSAESAVITFLIADSEFSQTMTRNELEGVMAAKGFYQTLLQTLEKVMHIARRQGIFKEDIQHVLLIGGTALIPSVQDLLRGYFSKNVVQVEKPFTAVAEGALIIATGLGLDDYLAHSYGLRYLDLDSSKHRYDEVIPLGSRYPSKKPVEIFLGAAHDNQAAVEFVIGEIEIDAVTAIEVKYEDGQAVFVAQASPDEQQIIPLNLAQAADERARLDPPGLAGKKRLKARFRVNEKRQLCMRVVDLKRSREVIKEKPLIALQDINLAENIGFEQDSTVDGFEPCLVSRRNQSEQRLTLRKLGSLFATINPQLISLDVAVAALNSDDFYLRYQTAELLSKRGDRDARSVLEEFLNNGGAPQRAAVAHHLHRFSWYASEPLYRAALDDEDLRVRESAVYSLCQLGGPMAYALLLEAVSQEGDELKLAAAWGLSRNLDAGSLPVLQATLQAQDPEVRVLALEVIGATQAKEATGLVRQVLQDTNPDVVYSATLSLVELSGSECFVELADWIVTSRGMMRNALLRGIFHASNYLFLSIAESQAADQVIQAVREALLDEIAETRILAVKLLAWMRDDRADEILRDGYLEETELSVKAQMLYAVVSLMCPIGKRLLEDGLNDPAEEVQKTAEYLRSRFLAGN